VTNQVKGYPFETLLPPELPVRGVVLCDQMKSLDWTVRKAEFICELPEETLDDMVGKALVLLK
jgi:mRNA interferase MazF